MPGLLGPSRAWSWARRGKVGEDCGWTVRRQWRGGRHFLYLFYAGARGWDDLHALVPLGGLRHQNGRDSPWHFVECHRQNLFAAAISAAAPH